MLKINGKTIKGAIFDLDGTLFDSCLIWKDVDKHFFSKRGLEVPKGYGDEIGHLGLDEAAKYTINKFNLPETKEEVLKEWLDDVQRFYEEEVELKPNVKELLAFFKKHGVIMAVATANTPECYLPPLKKYDIYKYFDYILDVKKIPNGKKDALIYLKACSDMSLRPENVMVFEDILLGVRSSKDAGFISCAVYEKSCKDEEEKKEYADYYLESFDDLFSEFEIME